MICQRMAVIRKKGCIDVKGYWKDLRSEFAGYNAAKFAKDLMAGVTVAAVALPLALAFGVGSGASAASGLLTAVICGFVISLLGGAFYQISGPTGAMTAILMSIVAQYGMSGVFAVTVLAGVLLVLAGIFHLGRVTAYLPMPVITGFTSGIAVVIALGQVDNFFGTTSQGSTAVEKLLYWLTNGIFQINLGAVTLGLFVVLLMVVYPKRWNSVVPSSLVGIILAALLAVFAFPNVARVDEIPTTLLLPERFTLEGMNFQKIQALLPPAISIAALCMIESLLCGASAARMTGVPLNSDRELIAQGAGNLLSPFFGGIPATAAIARTSVAIKSGAQTRLTGMIHAVVLLVSMLLLAPVMAQIPLSALAGVLMVTAWRMNEWKTIRYLFSHRFKGAILKFGATMAATVLFDLTIAILAGVIVALILLVVRLSQLEINYERVNPERLDKPDGIEEEYRSAQVVYVTGSVIFANTEQIAAIYDMVQGAPAVLFSMRGTSYMDISGAQAFLQLVERLQEKQIIVGVCGVSQSVNEMMQRSGITQKVGKDRFYWSVSRALQRV